MATEDPSMPVDGTENTGTGELTPTQVPVDPAQQGLEQEVMALRADFQSFKEKVEQEQGKLKIFLADQSKNVQNVLIEGKSEMVSESKKIVEESNKKWEKSEEVFENIRLWQKECVTKFTDVFRVHRRKFQDYPAK